MSGVKILIVEDERIVAFDLENRLRRLGHSVCAIASSGGEAVQKTQETSPDLVLMDISLRGEMDGVQAAEQIQEQFGVPVIYLTAFSDEDTLSRVRVTGPYGYITKPFDFNELRVAIDVAIYRHQMDRKVIESERRYRDLVENIREVIYTVNCEGVITYVSPPISAFIGYDPDEIIGRPFNHFIYQEDLSRLKGNFKKSLSGEEVQNEYRVLTRDGQVRWMLTSSKPMLEGGCIIGVQGVLSDITEQKLAEEKLQLSEERYRIISHLTSDYYYSVSVDPDGSMKTDWVGGAFERITGYKASRENKVDDWISVINPIDVPAVERAIETVLSNRQSVVEYRIRTSSDQECWFEDHTYPIWDADQNRVVRFIGAVKDITQRKQAEARLEHLATHDLVTDLPNRVLFQDRLVHALGLAKRRQARIAVMFLDLDGFKVVNDTVGHDKGDQVLCEVARRLKVCTRKSDTVARLGGDEFGIVLENMSFVADAVTVAEKILSMISEPYQVENREFALTASIGISVFSDNISDFDTMMKRADIAMYQVKKEGKSGFKIFDASMTSET